MFASINKIYLNFYYIIKKVKKIASDMLAIYMVIYNIYIYIYIYIYI